MASRTVCAAPGELRQMSEEDSHLFHTGHCSLLSVVLGGNIFLVIQCQQILKMLSVQSLTSLTLLLVCTSFGLSLFFSFPKMSSFFFFFPDYLTTMCFCGDFGEKYRKSQRGKLSHCELHDLEIPTIIMFTLFF